MSYRSMIVPVLAAIVMVSTAAAPVSAPRVGIASFEALPKPLPLPYNETANADKAVAAAKLRARKAGKLLLIDLGGNWCLDCRLLAGTMELPALRPWVARHYEVVTVDVGRFDKNLQVPAHYGFHERLKGVPALLIVDPATDKLLNRANTTALSDARSLSPQGLADWLAKWARRPR